MHTTPMNPIRLFFVTRARVRQALLAALALFVSGSAFADNPGPDAGAFQSALDKPASALCKVAQVLPDSKWVGLAAFVMLLLGLALVFTRQRGGMAWVGYAVIGVAILGAVLAVAKGLGVGCS